MSRRATILHSSPSRRLYFVNHSAIHVPVHRTSVPYQFYIFHIKSRSALHGGHGEAEGSTLAQMTLHSIASDIDPGVRACHCESDVPDKAQRPVSSVMASRSARSLPRRLIQQHRTIATTTPRSYFSQHHPDPPPFPQAQGSILAAALKRVPEHGFTEEALSRGAKDVGYLDVSVQLFPRGVFDLINYYLVSQRLALKDVVQFPEDTKLGVGRKIKTLTMARLRANKDYIEHWQGVGWTHSTTYDSLTFVTGSRPYVSARKYTSIVKGAQRFV